MFCWNRKDSFQDLNETISQTPITHPPGGVTIKISFQDINETIDQTAISHPPGGTTICIFFAHFYARISVIL